MRILIAGARGLVGRALSEYCSASGDEVLTYDHGALDISNAELVSATIEQQRPDAVINCAAWTDVDGCESNSQRAFAANAYGPENLAVASRKVGAAFVTISTDYVFDGRKEGFYTQRDDPHPESVYGRSKLEGERRVQKAYARSIVVRSGFIFGRGGTNFLSTILDRARRGDLLKAISDAWWTPTYAPHLGMRLRELAQLDLPAIFHIVNSGEGASYVEFAQTALKAAGCNGVDLEAITESSLHRPAARPLNSRLKCLVSEAIGLAPLPSWQAALMDFAGAQAEKVLKSETC